MPVPIRTREEYEEVFAATKFVDGRSPSETQYVFHFLSFPEPPVCRIPRLTHHRFPTVLAFSKMYYFCCKDIWNFIAQFLGFTQENFDYPSIVDETLRKVCTPSARP